MRRALLRRIDHLAHRLPQGCAVCRNWPMFWVMGDGDPDPPEHCERCGRTPKYSPIRLVGISVAEI
jgi:hypothetical protein